MTPYQTLYKWTAPSRVFVERSGTFYGLISLASVVIIALAAATQQYLLIVVTIAVMILLYVSSTVKPQILEHEITNRGVRLGQQLYSWKNIEGFWLSERAGQLILVIDLAPNFVPNRILVLVGSGDVRKIVTELLQNSPYVSPRAAGIDLVSTFTYGKYLPISTWQGVAAPEQE